VIQSLLSSSALSFFYFCLSSILVLEFPRSVSSCSLCTSLLLFNFQRSSLPFGSAHALASTFLLYHFLPRLSIPFSKLFSKSFFGIVRDRFVVLALPFG